MWVTITGTLYQGSESWSKFSCPEDIGDGKKWAGTFYKQKDQQEWPDCELGST